MIISVIIPIYNVDKYLERCILSVLNQTYSELEIILVNDGSTDNSLSICEKYAKLDSRIILINHTNKGVAITRNIGLKAATGNYITFVDSDDCIESLMYETVCNILKNFDVDIVTTNYFDYEVGDKKYIEVRNELPYNKILLNDDIKEYFLKPFYSDYLGIVSSCSTKVYKMSFLKANNLSFQKHLKLAEDFWFNFEAYKYASSIYAIDKAFYHYFKNGSSIMRSFREDDFNNFLYTREKLKNNNLILKINVDSKKMDKKFIELSNEFILRALKNNKRKLVYSILKNKEFRKAYKNIDADRIHTKFIQKLLALKMNNFAIYLYKIWAQKI